MKRNQQTADRTLRSVINKYPAKHFGNGGIMSVSDSAAVFENGRAFENETESSQAVRPRNSYERIAGATGQRPKWIHFGSDEKILGFLSSSVIRPEDSRQSGEGIIVQNSTGKQSKTLVCSPELNAEASRRTEAVYSFDRDHETWDDLRQSFGFDSLELVTLSLKEEEMQFSKNLQTYRHEYANGPYQTASVPGKLASLLFFRFKGSQYPLAMMCLNADEQEAEQLRDIVLSFAVQWDKYGYVSSSFVKWLEKSISWPYACQTADGRQMVILDDFPNGRPGFSPSVRLVSGLEK